LNAGLSPPHLPCTSQVGSPLSHRISCLSFPPQKKIFKCLLGRSRSPPRSRENDRGGVVSPCPRKSDLFPPRLRRAIPLFLFIAVLLWGQEKMPYPPSLSSPGSHDPSPFPSYEFLSTGPDSFLSSDRFLSLRGYQAIFFDSCAFPVLSLGFFLFSERTLGLHPLTSVGSFFLASRYNPFLCGFDPPLFIL